MSFPPFNVWKKTKQKHIFSLFLKEKSNLLVKKKLHFIWKIITNSILQFQQGNELNQWNNDHEINNIHFANYQSLLCYLLLIDCDRASNNMMRVLPIKFVNNRQISWSIKNQRHQIQINFCSWSSKSTKWFLLVTPLWTEW